MSTTAKPSKRTPPIEAGTFQGICYQVIDLGTQYNDYYQKSSPKILLSWEIPTLRMTFEKDGETIDLPRIISKTYTNILHEKSNLFKDLVSWRGRAFTPEEADGFDVGKVLGANCLLTIVNTVKNNKTYANVASVGKLMADMTKMMPESEMLVYQTEDGLGAIPDSLPDWIKKMIHDCEEFNQDKGGQPNPNWVGDDPESIPEDSDIPF